MRRYVTKTLRVARWLAPLLAFVSPAHAAEVAVPKDLADWRGWVLHGEEFRRCPFVASRDASERESYRCAWPERLTLALDAHGGTFTQRWQVLAQSWVRVPGSVEHWPQDVRVNGAPAAVVARDGHPYLLLDSGTHAIAGKLSWAARPESLVIDSRTALVELTIDGKRIAQPERPNGDIWLGKRRTSEQPARMEVQVYRLLHDDVPARLLTRMHLQISGDGREELLARVLPDGFTPLALRTGLPARLEPDGRLRVQVRAGSWDIDLEARAAGVATRVARPPAGDGLWAREEVWSFAGDDRLRVAAAQGAEGIDPAQANVPSEWRTLPAFRMAQDSTLEISERSRGLRNADDNSLTLERRLWLDFDHGGLTAVDYLSGTMRKDWRLEMTGAYALQSARIGGGESLLVTRNPHGQGEGLEVRSPQLGLEAVVRTTSSRGEMPATGWNTRFDRVSGQLNLPPGHRLIAALGADRAPGAWVERWGLWALFGVLVVAVFAGWLAGWMVGAVAFVALVLTYQEAPGYIWLWGNLLAALALARAMPGGKLRRVALGYRAASFVVLGVALLPLLWGQARVALHPQLDARLGMNAILPTQTGSEIADRRLDERPAPPPPAEVDASARGLPMATEAPRMREGAQRRYAERVPMIAPAAPADSSALSKDALSESQDAKMASPYGLPSLAGAVAAVTGMSPVQVAQRYAPGTLVQAGPGIPEWRYLVYPYEWSGPVDPSQSVRFVFIGPVLLGIWRFAGIALLTALFLALLISTDRSHWPDPRDLFRRRAPAPSGTAARFGEPAASRDAVAGNAVARDAVAFSAPDAPAETSLQYALAKRQTFGWPIAVLLTSAFLASLFTATPSTARATPDSDLLDELKSRLTRTPDCAPTCADITSAQVTVRSDRLDISLQVSALTAVAIPIPSAGDRWQLDSITVDNRTSPTVSRESEGTLTLALSPGAHIVHLSGPLPAAESIQLEFPAPPRTIAVNSDGWDVAGVNEGRLLSGSLELVRRRSAAAGVAPLETSTEFPAFIRVTRTFDLGLDWSVATTVTRLAPKKAAITVEVPLLNGESALSETLRTRDLADGRRLALVGLERGQNAVSWSSGFARSETLDLELPADAARTEVWSFVVSPQWNVTFDGLPAVLPESIDPATWVYEFHPRPGEKLRARITRPERAEGSTLAVDSLRQSIAVGKRSSITTLEFQYRSTQGGRHALTLPKDARVTSVHLDGRPAPLRPDDGVLSVGLLPGSHSVRVVWETPAGVGVTTRPAAVDLHASASNVATAISLPADRWPLFTEGAGVGPAVTYWSEVVVFVLTALVLGPRQCR